jgi:hypothetical protein
VVHSAGTTLVYVRFSSTMTSYLEELLHYLPYHPCQYELILLIDLPDSLVSFICRIGLFIEKLSTLIVCSAYFETLTVLSVKSLKKSSFSISFYTNKLHSRTLIQWEIYQSI